MDEAKSAEPRPGVASFDLGAEVSSCCEGLRTELAEHHEQTNADAICKRLNLSAYLAVDQHLPEASRARPFAFLVDTTGGPLHEASAARKSSQRVEKILDAVLRPADVYSNWLVCLRPHAARCRSAAAMPHMCCLCWLHVCVFDWSTCSGAQRPARLKSHMKLKDPA